MVVSNELTPNLPVGFEKFHRRSFINYQLNRAHGLGFADGAELHEAASQIKSFADCVEVFEALSNEAATDGRYTAATSYLRIAEFFTPQQSGEKRVRYGRYRALFDRAFADAGVVRHDVPYGESSIPAYTLAAAGQPIGTVLIHGGFDSLIEEFFVIWQRFAAAGFDVVGFEGPGQGGARALNGLLFDHDWEKPVGAVLDHFDLDDVTLVGLSMGGYWGVRAAGLEPRISRLVIWPPVFDWMARLPRVLRRGVERLLRLRGFMNASIRVRSRILPVLKHAIDQALYLSGGTEPMDAVDWFLQMNEQHLGSSRVTQDVLVLVGENDTFQPPKLADLQVAALTSAQSVETRRFTAAEHADSHCQMGNLDLATSEVVAWLTRNTMEDGVADRSNRRSALPSEHGAKPEEVPSEGTPIRSQGNGSRGL